MAPSLRRPPKRPRVSYYAAGASQSQTTGAPACSKALHPLGDPFSEPTPSGQGTQGPLLTTNTRWAGRSGTPFSQNQHPVGNTWGPLLRGPTPSGQACSGTPSQNQHPVGGPTRGPLLSEPKPGGQVHSGTPFSEPTPGGQHPGIPFSEPIPGGQASSGTPSQNQRPGGWAHSGVNRAGVKHSLPPAGTWTGPAAKREATVTLLFLLNPPLPRRPAAATVLPCTGLASTTHGLHGPRYGPWVHLLTRRLNKRLEAGPSNQRDPFQPGDPHQVLCVQEAGLMAVSPTMTSLRAVRPGGGNEPREDARRPTRGTASLSQTHPALLSASIFHSTTQKVICRPWGSVDLAQGPAHPASGGRTRQALSSGAALDLFHVEGAPGGLQAPSCQQEVPGEESSRPCPFRSLPRPRCRVSPTETPSRPGG